MPTTTATQTVGPAGGVIKIGPHALSIYAYLLYRDFDSNQPIPPATWALRKRSSVAFSRCSIGSVPDLSSLMPH